MKHVRRTDQPTTGSTPVTGGTHAAPVTGSAPTTQQPAVPPQRTVGGEEHVGRTEHVEHVHHEHTHDDDRDVRREAVADHRRGEAKERFGGMNLGAAFFGWLVAIGMAAILVGIVGAVATAIGSNLSLSQADARQDAGGYGLAAAITLGVVLFLAYYAGGYVAGRMSRFDGARQGLGVWLVGLLVTLLVAAVGAVAGSQYDVLSRVDLPSIPVSGSTATWGGVITLVAVVVLTAVAAVLGGLAGHRYHTKVDRVAGLR